MSAADISGVKHRLRDYMHARAIPYHDGKKTWQCQTHQDNSPSAVLYENPDGDVLWCPICHTSLNIFGLAGQLEGIADTKENFPRILKSVSETLGIPYDDNGKADKGKQKSVPVALPIDKAREIYDEKFILQKGIDFKYGTKITGSWKYTDAKGDVIGLDVRFEGGEAKKSIITWWYDGKSLRWAKAPVMIYNLFEVLNEKNPVLFVEGAKCAEEARKLGHFIPISWSGGSSKVNQAEWPDLSGRELFILPDDDEPGVKAARSIKKRFPHAKIINPVSAAREIKPEGADICEILQVMTPQALTAYILNPSNILDVSDVDPVPPQPTATHSYDAPPSRQSGTGSTSEPFRILGIGDDGKANFIDQWGYHRAENLSSLSKTKLNELADLRFWKEEFNNGKNSVAWDEAIDYVICASKMREFDKSILRGRGAWHDGDKISYHDGSKTYGEKNPDMIYLKLHRVDIGIESPPANGELMKKIRDLLFGLSFETKTDAVRAMAWSVIAPFGGALQYRPTILLTGASSTGKSKVQELVIKKISNFIWADMRTTSPAGIRSRIGKDSAVVFFEEAGKENEKMKMNFEDMLAFMRSNYTENSPDSFKGTKEGGYVNYKLNSIFGLASTDPTIENIQDENRILRVNFVAPSHTADEWQAVEGQLMELLSVENCNAIRSLTWSRLKTIIKLTQRIVSIAKRKTAKDYRASYADMLLASAYMVVWCYEENPTDGQIEDMLNKYYTHQPSDEQRDESVEIVDRLMDEVIEIIGEGAREKITILECLNRVHTGVTESGDGERSLTSKEIMNYRQHAARFGVRVFEGNIAIANKHHSIKKIFNTGEGYQKILKRHPGLINPSYTITFPDKQRKCTILKGILKMEKTDDEKLEALMI